MLRDEHGRRARWRPAAALLALSGLLAGCMATVGPVQVTRFTAPDAAAQLGRGTIAVVPAPRAGEDAGPGAASIEYRSFAVAVAARLAVLGYRVVGPGEAPAFLAETAFVHDRAAPVPAGSPVSVGVGGSAGSGGGGGLGVGIGIDLSGPPRPRVATRLDVAIRRAADREVLWEGRAQAEAREGSATATTALSAARLADSLFAGFPGESGATIAVP